MGKGSFALRLSAPLVALILLFFTRFTGCLVTQSDRDQITKLEATLHERMTNGDIDGIYNDADPGFKEASSLAHHRGLFSAIDRKLGSPMDCVQYGPIQSKFGFPDTKFRAQCRTTFSRNASALETFVWVKSGNQYRLWYYYINSDELVNR